MKVRNFFACSGDTSSFHQQMFPSTEGGKSMTKKPQYAIDRKCILLITWGDKSSKFERAFWRDGEFSVMLAGHHTLTLH